MLRLTKRQILILMHDLAATAAALIFTFFVRFTDPLLGSKLVALPYLPFFLLYASAIYLWLGVPRNKWRLTSVPDLQNIVRASTILAVTLLIADYILVAPNVYGQFFFGKLTILLYWIVQLFALSASRMAYRYFRYTRTLQHAKSADTAPTLVLGRAADAEVLLRAIESGAVKNISAIGILSPSRADHRHSIRGIPVLGDVDDLVAVISDLSARGKRVSRVVMTPSAFASDARPDTTLNRARKLGLAVSKLPSLDASASPQLLPVVVEDLLLRPSVNIDHLRLEQFVRGKSVVVTGGGGSIGSEICTRLAAFGVSKLLIIESSEPALYAVVEALNAKSAKIEILGRIADVRDRERMMTLICQFKPQVVFHAAALKHVPILETDWAEGVKTNIFGSMHVADAAVAAKAEAMVMISTDKAIEPVSMLGATKRLAEMYCQALDHKMRRSDSTTRLISVRFGNVLASNGSVVPKFKAQIESGGPLTVTHPDMIRYFMTIREACDLVITAASHAVSPDRRDESVYVLNMGQPVRIVELAERMIRLSGLEPGRDIEIVFTGVRPGERLHEILFASEEKTIEIGIPGILAASPAEPPIDTIPAWPGRLQSGIERQDKKVVFELLRSATTEPQYQRSSSPQN